MESNDWFTCTVDDWRRTYRFGVNRNRKLFPEAFDEWDLIEVFGTVRHHDGSGRRGKKLRWPNVEVWISPTTTPREQWRDDPEAVGGVRTESGKLHVYTQFPVEVYLSLIPCFSMGHFKEMYLHVRNLYRRSGTLDSISLNPKETPLEDLEE
ncbi:MAG: hypothetical protein P1P84_15080 [Deferrisomatales bacterium]|nr:hypothetical protein [Deferrisomatales bacterium]